MNRSRASAARPRQMATIWRSAIEQASRPARRAASAKSRRSKRRRARSRACARRRTGRGEAAEVLVDRDVLGDRQVGEEGQVLVDDLDAERLGARGREVLGGLAVELDPAARLGLVDAGHELDQGGLAAAVLADEAVHLAAARPPSRRASSAVTPPKRLRDADAGGSRGAGVCHGPRGAGRMDGGGRERPPRPADA